MGGRGLYEEAGLVGMGNRYDAVRPSSCEVTDSDLPGGGGVPWLAHGNLEGNALWLGRTFFAI